MSEPFIGEVRLFAGTFAPRNWAFCAGQVMAISQYSALFSLLGTNYGGNGMTTFGLPDLQGRVPLHRGDGPGLTSRVIGEAGGQETVTLTTQEMPAHRHEQPPSVSDVTATSRSAVGNVRAVLTGDQKAYATPGQGVGADVVMASSSPVGGGQPHENRQPYLGINYIIALVGVFPSRS